MSAFNIRIFNNTIKLFGFFFNRIFFTKKFSNSRKKFFFSIYKITRIFNSFMFAIISYSYIYFIIIFISTITNYIILIVIRKITTSKFINIKTFKNWFYFIPKLFITFKNRIFLFHNIILIYDHKKDNNLFQYFELLDIY